jgi:hypothetical protein
VCCSAAGAPGEKVEHRERVTKYHRRQLRKFSGPQENGYASLRKSAKSPAVSCLRLIRSIETDSSGKQIARDAHFNRLDFYDPKTDRTRDSHFRNVRTGNPLAALISRTTE